MIIQFFPNIRSIKTMVYSVNPRGAIEIIPKASGISIYSPPTTMSTHTLQDEYLKKEPRYRTSGMRLLAEDDGYECLIIYSGIHGRYLQAGKADRDAYTGPNYIPPPKKNPPRPWSCKIKGTELTPIEICYTGVAIPEIYSGIANKGAKDETENTREHKTTTTFKLEHVTAALLPCNVAEYLRALGERRVGTTEPSKLGMSFVEDIMFLRVLRYEVFPVRTTLADMIPEAGILPDQIFPDPDEGLSWSGMRRNGVVPFPYLLEPLKTALNDDTFQTFGGLDPIGGKDALALPFFTQDVTQANPKWKKIPDPLLTVRAPRCEWYPDWIVVTYDPIKAPNKDLFHKFGLEQQYDADTQLIIRPLCIVPVVIRFQPLPPYRSPLDHTSGRRLFHGHSLVLYAMNAKRVYTEDTKIAATVSIITHPITKNPIYEGPVNLREHLGYPPPERVEDEVEEIRKIPINEREEEEITYEALQDRANMFLENFPVALPEEGEEIARAALADILDRADVQIVMENLLTAVDKSWEDEVTVRNWKIDANATDSFFSPRFGQNFYNELRKKRLEKLQKMKKKKKKEEEIAKDEDTVQFFEPPSEDSADYLLLRPYMLGGLSHIASVENKKKKKK